MLKRLIESHARYTGSSARAGDPREAGRSTARSFVKVFPKEYRRALGELAAQSSKRLAA